MINDVIGSWSLPCCGMLRKE